eukprot:497659-Hanusia_phi.AAC.3
MAINSTISSSLLPVSSLTPIFDLAVMGAAFTTKIICQTSSYFAAKNRIHVRFITNVDLHGKDGSEILITGLYDSGTKNSEISLDSPNSEILNVGKWDRDMGTLIVNVLQNSTLSSGILYEFSFVLQNPTFESASLVEIASSGSHYIPKSNFESGNCIQPFRTSSNLVTELQMTQSVLDPGSYNVIRILFHSNAEFRCDFNHCILGGLTSLFVYKETSFVSNCSLSLDHWESGTGNFLLVTGSDQVPSGASCQMEFTVTNPCDARASDALQLQLNASTYYMTANQLVASDGPSIAVSYVYDNLFPCANNTLRIKLRSNHEVLSGFTLRIMLVANRSELLTHGLVAAEMCGERFEQSLCSALQPKHVAESSAICLQQHGL